MWKIMTKYLQTFLIHSCFVFIYRNKKIKKRIFSICHSGTITQVLQFSYRLCKYIISVESVFKSSIKSNIWINLQIFLYIYYYLNQQYLFLLVGKCQIFHFFPEREIGILMKLSLGYFHGILNCTASKANMLNTTTVSLIFYLLPSQVFLLLHISIVNI